MSILEQLENVGRQTKADAMKTYIDIVRRADQPAAGDGKALAAAMQELGFDRQRLEQDIYASREYRRLTAERAKVDPDAIRAAEEAVLNKLTALREEVAAFNAMKAKEDAALSEQAMELAGQRRNWLQLSDQQHHVERQATPGVCG